MHFMPEDIGYEEKLWPDGYKAVIRNRLPSLIASALRSEETLKNIYIQQYTGKFPDLDHFIERITDMLVIGAEKGGDDVFDEIVTTFLYEDNLPEPRIYARYLLISKLPEEIGRELMQQVIDDYSRDEVFLHAYKVGYSDLYETFEQFLNATAILATVGTVNGIDDMLASLYKAFASNSPLPPARRNPKRIKNWFVPAGSKKCEIPLSRRGKQRRQKEKSDAENSGVR